MEILFYIAIVVVAILVYSSKGKNFGVGVPKGSQYKYLAKEYFMTKSESEFFLMLNQAIGNKYYIFPQAHLSAILNHKVPGQNWKYAFSHINGKSVDYVLCDKQTLKTVYAIELDDYTHSYADRQERDGEVERMLSSTGIQLIRVADYKTFDVEKIAKRFAEIENSSQPAK